MSCNQDVIDSATYLLKISLSLALYKSLSMPAQQFCIKSALSLTTIKTVEVLCSQFHDSLYKEVQGVKLTGSRVALINAL